MAFDFTGKKVLVTGAGRGIGRAIAIALAKSGCKVYALSRTKSTLDTLVQEYPDITPITQDLSKWDETRKTLEELDALDGLVNNAGSEHGPIQAIDISKETLDQMLRNNLLSAINCIQVIGKKMIASGKGGSIVNMSSIVSTFAFPSMLGYNVSKAGLDMVTKQFALELGPKNIRVNSVNPTFVNTGISSAELMKQYEGIFLERTPMTRSPTMDEVASLVMYLLSDVSAMITGALHPIDGGLTSNITTKT